jgi:exopolysaccharide biosynthesis polyprenyl glycosylphosphotransferase
MTTNAVAGWAGSDGGAEDRPHLLLERAPAQTRSRALDLHGLAVMHLLVLVDLLAWVGAILVTSVGEFRLGVAALVVLTLTLNFTGGLYAPKLALSVLDEVPPIVGRALVAAAVVTSLRVVSGERVGTLLIGTGVVFACLAVTGRAAGYVLVRQLRRRGMVSHRTLILGAGRVAGWVTDVMQTHPEHGLRPVGFLDGDPLLNEDERAIPVLGDMSQLASVLHEQNIRCVVVAFGSDRESGIVDVLRTCDRYSCEIFFVPRLYELQAGGPGIDHVWSLPLVRLPRAPFRSATWRAKRAFDVVASATAIVLLAPVLAACAMAVRWRIGPVLFRQRRVGLDGREFMLLKFRSLTPVDEGESASNWNISDDSRLTTVGRVLRATSLDELPQLFNILRGDMSIVGPRPERPFFVEEFKNRFPRYMDRHRVPAGLTGWAQIHGLRGDTSIEDRARFDNYYIENWSLWQDVKIILRTVAQVVRAGGR